MKKLFGFLTLFLCLLLTACNMNLLSDRSGSIDFSIPTKDIIDAANNYAARGADNDQSNEYVFLLQIIGNKKYYDYQVQTVTIQTGIGSVGVNGLETSGQYLRDNNINFTFNQIPSGQTYKVVFDMLVKKGDMPFYKVFSGGAENIKVKAGKTAEAGVSAKFFNNSFICLKMEFEDGSNELFSSSSAAYIYLAEHQASSAERKTITKSNGKLEFNNKTIKDIYYVLDSNLKDSRFNYSISYIEGGKENKYSLNFSNNVCSIKDFLLNGLKSDSFGQEITISNDKIRYVEKLNDLIVDTSGDLTVSYNKSCQLSFLKLQYEANKYAYVSVNSLSSLLSQKPSKGDTVVLVLTKANGAPFNQGTQLYYKLANPDTMGTDGAALFDGNFCINHSMNEQNYYIPLNFIENPDDSLFLFMNCADNADDPLDIYVEAYFYVFPKEMNTFVFGVGCSYDEEGNPSGHRYEFNQSIGNMILNQHDNVSAVLKGRLCTVNFGSGQYQYFSNSNTLKLTGELYDGGFYHKDGDSSDYFHPLSNDEAVGNKKEIDFASDYSEYPFKFMDIIEPYSADGYKNDFRFLCTADFTEPVSDSNPPELLLIQYFDLSFAKN